MKDRVAIVTGAATGIGAATVRRLAAAGCKVVLCDINEGEGVSLAEEVGGTFVACDVSDFGSVENAAAVCEETYGIPDYAHLNAGIMTVPAGDPFLAIEEVSLEQYRRITGVNLDGVYHGVKALLPRMRDSGGAITITSSIAGFGVLPVDPLYAMTKYGLVGFGRAIAAANAESKVRINVICPGVVDTYIVPDNFRGPEIMTPDSMAAEVVDLLENGPNGEIRVKLADEPAFAMEPQEL